MTIEQLGSLGEFIAAIAVLISLVYVGYQVKQNTVELRQAAFRDVYQAYSNLRRSIYSNPELLSLLTRSRSTAVEDITEEERLLLDNYFTEQLWTTVQLWLMVSRGALEYSDSSWQLTVESILTDMDSPAFREYWSRLKGIFPESFTREMDRFIRARDT